jgi:hypothetical protein
MLLRPAFEKPSRIYALMLACLVVEAVLEPEPDVLVDCAIGAIGPMLAWIIEQQGPSWKAALVCLVGTLPWCLLTLPNCVSVTPIIGWYNRSSWMPVAALLVLLHQVRQVEVSPYLCEPARALLLMQKRRLLEQTRWGQAALYVAASGIAIESVLDAPQERISELILLPALWAAFRLQRSRPLIGAACGVLVSWGWLAIDVAIPPENVRAHIEVLEPIPQAITLAFALLVVRLSFLARRWAVHDWRRLPDGRRTRYL